MGRCIADGLRLRTVIADTESITFSAKIRKADTLIANEIRTSRFQFDTFVDTWPTQYASPLEQIISATSKLSRYNKTLHQTQEILDRFYRTQANLVVFILKIGDYLFPLVKQAGWCSSWILVTLILLVIWLSSCRSWSLLASRVVNLLSRI